MPTTGEWAVPVSTLQRADCPQTSSASSPAISQRLLARGCGWPGEEQDGQGRQGQVAEAHCPHTHPTALPTSFSGQHHSRPGTCRSFPRCSLVAHPAHTTDSPSLQAAGLAQPPCRAQGSCSP